MKGDSRRTGLTGHGRLVPYSNRTVTLDATKICNTRICILGFVESVDGVERVNSSVEGYEYRGNECRICTKRRNSLSKDPGEGEVVGFKRQHR